MGDRVENDAFTILIADDSELEVAMLREGIAAQGRNLVCVYSGKAVLEYLENHLPDLILLDVMMPDMDGYEVCARIKRQDATKRIPVIFLTALVDAKAVAKGFEMGAIDYIVKPYRLTEVNARIKSHLLLQREHKKTIHLLDSFASSVAEAVIMVDESGNVLDVFGDCIRYFPRFAVSLEKRTLSDILPETFCERLRVAIDTVYRTREAFSFETECLLGEQQRVLQVVLSLADASGVVGIKLSDITDRRSVERKMDLTYEYQKRSRFFNGLLAGNYSEEQQLQLLSVYGIEYEKPLVCYMVFASSSPGALRSVFSLWTDIGEWLMEKGYGWIWNGNFGTGLLMQYPDASGEIERLAALLKEELEMRFPGIIVRIGVSSTAVSGMNFKQLYYDALGAAMMAVGEKRDYAVAQTGKFELNELLVHAIKHMDVDRFVDRVLGKIKNGGGKNAGELLGTLEQLIAAPSIKRAASNLFIHPNTVLWRKQKIEELLDVSLDDTDVRTQINLAFKFMRIRNFIKHTNDDSTYLSTGKGR